MRNFTLIELALLLSITISCSDKRSGDVGPEELVNTLMGTDTEYILSNGNTYPAVAMPWGMNFWTPHTRPMNNGWGYQYDDHKIMGIKQTHQPSPWINDYGAFSLMAMEGALKVGQEERASWFSHKAEEAHPWYYSVYLADYDVVAEVTVTERAAIHRYTFPESDSSYIIIDGFDKGSMVRIIPDERKVIGWVRNNHGGVPANFHNYFVAQFDKGFDDCFIWNDDIIEMDSLSTEGFHTGAVLRFSTGKNERINVKIASSFISIEQAQTNLNTEVGESSFDEISEKGKNIWNRELSKLKVEGGTPDQQRTFYSALYRVLLFPRMFYEYDAKGNIVHYSPYNGEVLPGYMFTDNGFWDTFRAVFPFFTLVFPELNGKIMEGLVNTYKESGWLPEWASPGHRNCMIGSNSSSIIADSWLKGIRGYDIETLYEAMINSSKSQGPLGSVGRMGAGYYNDLGYVPYDVGINENAARTLEYAYADFCIWQLGINLSKEPAETDIYRKRAYNYKNVFDSTRKLMRGRNLDGSFQSPFSPYKWGDAFTEGNSWHYTWSVFQDVEGLINLMGGDKEFTAKLDSVFTVPPIFDESYYGTVIHEIREMQIMNMGNYAHGNQPIQHMVYLYNYAGEPWKTQFRVREIMDKLYNYTPDGYCGDEDNGQTSAWYVFSAMGFYPVTPGSNQYVLGAPLFDKMTITFENGNKLKIIARDNSKKSVYVKNLKFRGKTIGVNWLDHNDLLMGGKLLFLMSEKPSYSRGTTKEASPFSMSGK